MLPSRTCRVTSHSSAAANMLFMHPPFCSEYFEPVCWMFTHTHKGWSTNHNLRLLAQHAICFAHLQEEDIAEIRSLQDQLHFPNLVRMLESYWPAVQSRAAEVLRQLMVDNPDNQVKVLKADGWSSLMRLFKNSTSREVQEQAGMALATMACHQDNHKQLVLLNGLHFSLVRLLASDSIRVQEQAAEALASLGGNAENLREVEMYQEEAPAAQMSSENKAVVAAQDTAAHLLEPLPAVDSHVHDLAANGRVQELISLGNALDWKKELKFSTDPLSSMRATVTTVSRLQGLAASLRL